MTVKSSDNNSAATFPDMDDNTRAYLFAKLRIARVLDNATANSEDGNHLTCLEIQQPKPRSGCDFQRLIFLERQMEEFGNRRQFLIARIAKKRRLSLLMTRGLCAGDTLEKANREHGHV